MYEDIARKLASALPNLTVAAVECNAHEPICSSHGVNGYPSVILYPGDFPPMADTTLTHG